MSHDQKCHDLEKEKQKRRKTGRKDYTTDVKKIKGAE